MPKSIAQLIVDAKNAGWYDYILQPDGELHPNDERALLDGCYFDIKAAQDVMRFFVTALRIKWDAGTELNEWERTWIDYYLPGFPVDQRRGTKPFVLLKWWYDRVIAPLFGWKRKCGKRRFDKGFMTTAKKSGKSSTLSGLPLYMISADGEHEAEAYATAKTESQAEIIFKKAHHMACSRTAVLREAFRGVPSENRIVYDQTASFFEAIASDAGAVEGKNPHLLIADELHVWQDKQFFQALMYGDISRAQPLFLMITTAGEDLTSVGYEEYQFACDLADPNKDMYSMSHFAYIAEAGRDLDTGEVAPKQDGNGANFKWDDPKGWIQANPSLLEGVGSIDKLKAKCKEAKETPSKKRSFIRYICNRWVAASDSPWINRDYWDECQDRDLELEDGQELFCGFDFASVEDLVALSKVWWIEHDLMGLDVVFYMPEDGVLEKEQRWRVPLRDWINGGYIRTTPGRVVDHATIRWELSGVAVDENGATLEERNPESLDEKYAVQSFAFDRAHTRDLVIVQLGEYDGMPVVEHGQGYLSMTVPSKEFHRRICEGTIRVVPNPVLDWQIDHCIVTDDPAGSIKPNKKKSRHKIDGVVASIMGCSASAAFQPPAESIYETRGVLTF